LFSLADLIEFGSGFDSSGIGVTGSNPVRSAIVVYYGSHICEYNDCHASTANIMRKQKMLKTIKLLATVSRPEFLPANSASLVLGISWGINPPLDLVWGLAIPAVLVFSIITLVSAVAAQVNTMSDYELDLKDATKKKLVQAMSALGRGKVKYAIAAEVLLSLALILALSYFQGRPALLLMWVAAVFLAYSYSNLPLRLKSRSWLAPVSLLIVLSILPITFVFYSFSTEITYFFLLFLSGQALIVYGVIVPAEIRDYASDKAMGVKTMTVRLGLVKASLLSIALLSVGGMLCGTGFFLRLAYSPYPAFTALLIVMAVTHGYIFRKYLQLYHLSKEYASSGENGSINKIVELAAQNPRWITIVTQTIVFMALVLVASKFLP
jgi:4-hydroxybenzoate polyprenyltransferase